MCQVVVGAQGKIKEGKWNKMPGRMVKKAPLRKWYSSKTYKK